MATDPHRREHEGFDHAFMADALVLLDDHEATVSELCWCGGPLPCAGANEPEPRSVRAFRPAPPVRP